MTKISLAIPTYKRYDKFLSKYIPLYLKNPYIDEIIISDEDGEDKSKIDRFYPKIKTYRNIKPLGAFYNKLKAISLCRNEWVCLMDSDNFADESYFEALLKYWSKEEPKQHCIYSPCKASSFDFTMFAGAQIDQNNYRSYYNKNNGKMDILINTGNYVLNKKEVDLIDFTIYNNVTNHPADVAFFNYIMLTQRASKIVVVPDMHYSHVIHDGSFYLTESQKYDKEIKETYNKLNTLMDKGLILPPIFPKNKNVVEYEYKGRKIINVDWDNLPKDERLQDILYDFVGRQESKEGYFTICKDKVPLQLPKDTLVIEKIENEMTYYDRLDHYGDDIICVSYTSLQELKKKCIEYKGVAFNTYGYIKKKVDTSKLISLPEGHGLYVLNS